MTPEEVGERDVGVQDGKIVAVTWPGTLPVDAGRLIEAGGKIVVPGGIEPHAHIAIPVPEAWAGRPEVMTQPPEAASRAAAFGGVTTIKNRSNHARRGKERRPSAIQRTTNSITNATQMTQTKKMHIVQKMSRNG